MTRAARLESQRRSRARYRARHAHRCPSCGSRRDLPGVKCSWCRAVDRERFAPWLVHHPSEHRRWIRRALRPGSRCAASGRTLVELERVGLWLEVDRIDPEQGYRRGNLQLLASSLNRAKARSRSVPPRALELLAARLAAGPMLEDTEAGPY